MPSGGSAGSFGFRGSVHLKFSSTCRARSSGETCSISFSLEEVLALDVVFCGSPLTPSVSATALSLPFGATASFGATATSEAADPSGAAAVPPSEAADPSGVATAPLAAEAAAVWAALASALIRASTCSSSRFLARAAAISSPVGAAQPYSAGLNHQADQQKRLWCRRGQPPLSRTPSIWLWR